MHIPKPCLKKIRFFICGLDVVDDLIPHPSECRRLKDIVEDAMSVGLE
jgi:hypothetical protein